MSRLKSDDIVVEFKLDSYSGLRLVVSEEFAYVKARTGDSSLKEMLKNRFS
jgi:hypothetical protein